MEAISMKLTRRLYSIQVMLALAIPFIGLFPIYLILCQKEKWHIHAYKLNRLWAKIFFFLGGIPVEVEYRGKLDKNQQYIFCPNHSSFLDIPTIELNRHPFAFVGKSSIEKVPVFGYMYRKLHITVDRNNLKSRYESVLKSREAIDMGKSLVFFPEGGILTTSPPKMTRFKDGPFRVAIEKTIPLVPVTIPYNWIILPDNGKFLLNKKHKKVKIIFHEPIVTNGLTIDNLEYLKKKTFDTIDSELKKQQTYEDQR